MSALGLLALAAYLIGWLLTTRHVIRVMEERDPIGQLLLFMACAMWPGVLLGVSVWHAVNDEPSR